VREKKSGVTGRRGGGKDRGRERENQKDSGREK
jgi:hypothetical protein